MTASADKAKSVFLSAAELATAEERLAFLEASCGGDTILRREVDDLLKHHAVIAGFLEAPNDCLEWTAADPPNSERPGSCIGPYTLLQQIGEGGMGVVFMAEQSHPVQRKVAIKVIKAGMDTRQVIARFEAERQALAMMDHINIARVLDVGATESGWPYFVMELVHGLPITQYCDNNRLTPHERLELFVPVCHAIQHAHQKGIIHRDIKPSNVMVTLYDGKPVPKIIDFGVAKATEQKLTQRTLFTQYGMMVGTFEYMSPEQAEMSALGVDTRSDIYSLGVLLYELLTGSTPLTQQRLEQAAFAEVVRMIKEEEPPKPSTRLVASGDTLASISAQRHMEPAKLAKLLCGELDWIVMKCLEKDRNRRYETASAIAADVQRYLADEPVQACPPSAWYRFRKFGRRNRAAIVTASLVVVALLAGTALATWQAVRATRAMSAADEQAALATSITKYLQQMLSSIEPDSGKGLDYTVRQLLDDHAGDLEKQLPDQPEVEATLQGVIGRAYACLGQRDKGRKHLARALVLRRNVFGDQHEKYADALVDRARPDASNWSELPEREADLRRALAVYRARGLGGKPVVYVLWTLQWVLVEQAWAGAAEKWDEIEPVWMEAMAEAAKSPGVEFPEIVAIQSGLIQALLVQSRYGEAEALARQTLAMRLRLRGPDHLFAAWGYYVLGEALRAQHKFTEAIQAEKQALAIMRKYLPPEHRNVTLALKSIIDTLDIAAKSHALIDQFPSVAALGDLESVFRELLKSTKPSKLDDDDPALVALWGLTRFSEFYVELSGELAAAGKPGEAEESRKKANLILEDMQTQHAGNPDLLPFICSYGAIALANTGQPMRAKEQCRKLMDLATPNRGMAHNKLAWFLANAEIPAHRDPILAIELAKRACAADPLSSNHLNSLGVAHYRAGDWKQAILELERSLAIGSPNSFSFYFLAMANWKLGEKEKAREWYDRAMPDKRQPANEELRRFQAEAAELLEVK